MSLEVIPFFLLAPNTRGQDGTASESSVSKSETIDAESKNAFPEDLLLIIRRQAVDFLLADRNDQKGRDALQFIVDMTTGRKDLQYIMIGKLLEKTSYLLLYC